MRHEGVLTTWNDERGFGRIESTQGGEPIFAHISAWPRGASRPQVGQRVSFEVEVGPRGKRARHVQPGVAKPATAALRQAPPRRERRRPERRAAAWGGATLLVIPAFLGVFLVATVLWRVPLVWAAIYLGASVVTFLAYAVDKSAAARGAWRVSEGTLHGLALAGGWPGALLAQQLLRHKSVKATFRAAFWGTVVVNVAAWLLWVSPLRARWLRQIIVD